MPTDIVLGKFETEDLGFEKVLHGKITKKPNTQGSLVLAEPSKWAYNDKSVDYVINAESTEKKDFMHHRASGMNQVTAKSMKEKDIGLLFSFNSVLKSDRKGMILGRMMQNVKLCRKYKVKMKIASLARNPLEMRTARDLQAFGETIGMHPKEAKDAMR